MRAIAALAVLGAHTHLVPGGFVGVDIFFVISGFLISGIILRALAGGNFRISEFYAKRAKRILPALLVVLVAVTGAGWVILLAGEFQLLGREIAEGAGFVRDLSPYWRQDVGLHFELRGIDLSHLWSLGVEEQFYLLWPLLLVTACKIRRSGFVVITIATAISFVINIVLSSKGSGAAYFPPLPRLWELSIGGMLAYAESDVRKGPLLGKSYDSRCWVVVHIGNAAGLVGMSLIVWSLISVDSPAFFPGWQALAPCLGTVLLIAAGPQSWINRYFLGTPPLVFMGLISYPFYLWHVPLLQIPGVIWPDITPAMTVGAVVATVVLAYATYKYIEVPVRSSRRTTFMASTLVASTLACLLAGIMISARLIPPRSQTASVTAFLQASTEDWLPGTHGTSWTLAPGGPLTLGTGSRRTLYVGDSNMQQYYPRISRLLAEHQDNRRGAIFAVREWCAPAAFELADTDETTRATCRHFLRDAFEYANHPAVDTVVIGGCWPCYFFSVQDLFAGATDHALPGTDRALEALGQLVARLVREGKHVYVILSGPIGADLDPRQMIRRTIVPPGFKVVVRTPRESEVAGTATLINAKLRKIALLSGASVIDPVAALCAHTFCSSVASSGGPMYHDWWNLSPSYVRENVRFLDGTVLDVDVNRVRAPGRAESELTDRRRRLPGTEVRAILRY